LKTAILFVIMLLVLIIPHELGHMIVAKLVGVKVNEFSVGMGPLLLKRKKGETQYSLRLLPLGGFCALEGEEEMSDDERAYNNKSPLQKIAILLAGITMNVFIAIVVMTVVAIISGVPTNKIASVENNTPAYEAGIRAGDRIVEIDGIRVSSWEGVTEKISGYQEGDMKIVVRNDEGSRTFTLKPEYDKENKRYVIGIVTSIEKKPLLSVKYGVKSTWNLTKMMIKAFQDILTRGIQKDDVSGPVGLVKIVGQTQSHGIEAYLILLALVSLNLAFFNIIPIPGLDGGKIFFIFLKIITGGRIGDEMEYKATMVGMVILFSIFIFVTINDVMNLF